MKRELQNVGATSANEDNVFLECSQFIFLALIVMNLSFDEHVFSLIFQEQAMSGFVFL